MNSILDNTIKYENGFYDMENDGERDFRWMRKCGKVKFENTENLPSFIEITLAAHKKCELLIGGVGHNFRIKLNPGWQTRTVSLDKSYFINGVLSLKCDFSLELPNDKRELSLMIADIKTVRKEDLPEIIYQDGFYDIENDGIRNFRWMQKEAVIYLNSCVKENDSIIFEVGNSDSMPISFSVGKEKVTLLNGWQQLCFNLKEIVTKDNSVTFECEFEHNIKNDDRELSVMISDIKIGIENIFEKNSKKLSQEVYKEYNVKSYPTFLTYETFAKCNLKCAMCAVDESLNEFKHDRISGIDKTKKIYKRLLPYASKLQLHASGECLLGKDFWYALEEAGKFAEEHSMEIETFTNGLLLNEVNRKKLLDSALTDIVISVDAATETTYKRIRGGNFELLKENIRNLVKEKLKFNNNRLRITMAFVMMRENICELPSFIELAHSLGVNTVSFWPLFSSGEDMPIKEKENFQFYYRQQMLAFYPNLTKNILDETILTAEKLNVRIGETPCFEKEYSLKVNEDFEYPMNSSLFDDKIKKCTIKDNASQNKFLYKNCYVPWKSAFITTEGKFAPCVLLMYKGGIDNAVGKTFDEVWNSPLMQDLRKHIIEGKIHPLCKGSSCIFVDGEK